MHGQGERLSNRSLHRQAVYVIEEGADSPLTWDASYRVIDTSTISIGDVVQRWSAACGRAASASIVSGASGSAERSNTVPARGLPPAARR